MTVHPIDLFVRYVTDDVDERERDLVERHLAACAECRRELAVIARMHATLDALPPEHPDDTLTERVMARTSVQARVRRGSSLRLLAAAAVLVMATAAVTAWTVRRVSGPSPQAEGIRSEQASPAAGQRLFMLFFFEDLRWRQELPAERRRARGNAFSGWIRELDRQGRLISGGRALPHEGGRIVATGGRITRLDGLIPEGEVLSGYIVVSAADYDEATQLTLACPIVTEGRGQVVVRQVSR